MVVFTPLYLIVKVPSSASDGSYVLSVAIYTPEVDVSLCTSGIMNGRPTAVGSACGGLNSE